jgi:hypothetical protein
MEATLKTKIAVVAIARRSMQESQAAFERPYRESDADERRRREDAALYELNLRRNRR